MLSKACNILCVIHSARKLYIFHVYICVHPRLGLDYVDLYLMHSPLKGKVVETWNAMIELKKQGKSK